MTIARRSKYFVNQDEIILSVRARIRDFADENSFFDGEQFSDENIYNAIDQAEDYALRNCPDNVSLRWNTIPKSMFTTLVILQLFQDYRFKVLRNDPNMSIKGTTTSGEWQKYQTVLSDIEKEVIPELKEYIYAKNIECFYS